LYLAKQASLALKRVMSFAPENGSATESPNAKGLAARSPAAVASATGADSKPAPETPHTLGEPPALKVPAVALLEKADAPEPAVAPRREPVVDLDPAPASVVPQESAVAAGKIPAKNPQEPPALDETIPVAFQKTVPVAPPAQPVASAEMATTVVHQERTVPVPARTSETNAEPIDVIPVDVDADADADAPPVLVNILPQLRMMPLPPEAPRLVPEEWDYAAPARAYPETESPGVPERVLSPCRYDALRPIPPRSTRLPEPEPAAPGSRSPGLPAFSSELRAEIAEYPEAPMVAPSVVPSAREPRRPREDAVDFPLRQPALSQLLLRARGSAGVAKTGLQTGALETGVLDSVAAETGAGFEASPVRVDATDFPLPQPSLPRALLSTLETSSGDTADLPTGASGPGVPEGITLGTAPSCEAAMARVSEELLAAGALASWADEARDAETQPVIVSAHFVPGEIRITRPLTARAPAPALAQALPCEEAGFPALRNCTSETAPKNAVAQGEPVDFLHAEASGQRQKGLRMPPGANAGASPRILPGAGVKPVHVENRPGTFDARQSWHTPRAFIRGLSGLHFAPVRPARAMQAKLGTPQVHFLSPRLGVLEPCATVPARTSEQAYDLPQRPSLSGIPFPVINGSLPRDAVFRKYDAHVLRTGEAPAASAQNNRVRWSPASLFGLPKAGGQIHVPSPTPDALFKPLARRTAMGPGAASVLVAVPAPSLPLMFHWAGTIARTALPKQPLAELRAQTFAGARTRPTPAPPQRIETIRAAIDISLEAPQRRSVRSVKRLTSVVPDGHAGSAPAAAKPHLVRTRLRPASWIALPPIPAEVLGPASSNPLEPLPESLPKAHECGERTAQSEPQQFPGTAAGARGVWLRDGSSLLNPVSGPSGEELHLSYLEPANLLILKDKDVSPDWPAPESLAGQRGPTLPCLHCLDIPDAVRLGITMKKSGY
jgi:hypothetical protein